MNKVNSIILGTAFALSGSSCENIGVGNGTPQQQEVVIKQSEKFQEQYSILLKNLSQESRLYFAPVILDEGIQISANGNAEKYFITLSHAEIHGTKIITKFYESGEIGFSYLLGPIGIEGIKQKDGGFQNDLPTSDYQEGYQILSDILKNYNQNY